MIKSQYIIIANNDQAMEAAGEKAKELGYKIHLADGTQGKPMTKLRLKLHRKSIIFSGLSLPH